MENALQNTALAGSINSQTSKKIYIFQLIGSFLVVLVHSSGYKYFADVQGSSWAVLFDYLNKGLPFACVSMFAFMSGFLLFKGIDGALDKKEFFKVKMKGRVRTILVPYLIWNILSMLFVLFISVVPFLSAIKSSSFAEFDFSVRGVLEGIFLYKYDNNWYLFHLMKYILFCPLIYICLKNKKTAYAFLAVVFAYCGIKVEAVPFLSGDYSYSLFMLFCLGAFLSVNHFDWINKRYSKKTVALAFVGLIAVSVIAFVLRNSSLNEYVKKYFLELFRIIFVLLIWIACDIFVNINVKGWMKNSFFIYLMHGYTLMIVSKTFCMLCNKIHLNQVLSTLLNMTLVPVATIVVIEIIAFVLKKYFNKLWCVLTGGRG